MTDADNGTSDVAAVEVDGSINIDEGLFELDTVAPECDGAIWVMTVQGISKGAISCS
jgi:hypothetical protein